MKANLSRFVAGLALLQFAVIAQTTVAFCGERVRSDRLCGPNSLLVAIRKLGADATIDELTTLSGWKVDRGTSLLGLQNAAKAKGLESIVMKIGLDDLLSFKGSVIAHLWGDHFVVLEQANAGSIMVTDPPGKPTLVKTADFQNAYSGFALLIARDASAFPKPKDVGPDLRFDSYSWAFGAVDKGDIPTYAFKCRNAGSTELTITKVDTSCEDCVGVEEWTHTIPPGSEGEVKVMVKTFVQQREVAKRIYVTSNDPISPIVRLDVTGYVRPAQLVFSPEAVNFGSPRRTETTTCEITALVQEEDGFAITSVSSDSPFVEARLSPSRTKDLPGYVITASLKPGAPIGELKAKITVVSDHTKQPKAEIPVTATITGNVDLDRDSLFLGLAKQGKESVANVTVFTVSKDPLKIEKIDNPLNCVTVDVKPKTEGKEYILTATLKPDAPLGNIKGDITVHTNDPDQPEIKVPVYAYVEKPA